MRSSRILLHVVLIAAVLAVLTFARRPADVGAVHRAAPVAVADGWTPPDGPGVNPWAVNDGLGAILAALTPPTPPPPPRVRPRRPVAPPRTISPAPRYAGSAAGSVNGYPCGGDLPPCCVLARESGGNPLARNPRSSASGLWQFLDSTWAGFGGYPRAYLAPPDVQNEKARLVWAGGAGARHWGQTLC